MEMLKGICVNLDFAEVKSYIQSGNIVFKSKTENVEILTKQLSNAIEQQLGLQVPIIIFTLNELKQILNNNPYIEMPNKDQSFIHITFLAEIPKAENINQLNIATTDEYFIHNKPRLRIRNFNRQIERMIPKGIKPFSSFFN